MNAVYIDILQRQDNVEAIHIRSDEVKQRLKPRIATFCGVPRDSSAPNFLPYKAVLTSETSPQEGNQGFEGMYTDEGEALIKSVTEVIM